MIYSPWSTELQSIQVHHPEGKPARFEGTSQYQQVFGLASARDITNLA
jgi:hypothetical protein